MARKDMVRAWLIGATLIGWCLAVGAFWYSRQRQDAFEKQLDAAAGRTRQLQSQLDDSLRQLSASVQRHNQTALQAAEAEQRAEEETTLRTQAEESAEQARKERAAAQLETQQAEAQLLEVRTRREEELDKMRDALGKIAITRRTPSGMVMELADDSFRFDFDSSALNQDNREILSRIGGVLLASEGYRLFVYGHTDDVGSDAYNLDLSRRRAESVARYLEKMGLPKDIISIEGFGKRNPVVGGKTREARNRNRRVEIGIVDSIVNYKSLGTP